MKKDSIILFSVFICLAVLAIFCVFRNTDIQPYDYLVNEYRNSESVIKPVKLIDQVDLDDRQCLVFYVNGNGNIACAIIKQGFFTYRVLRVSAEVALASNNQTADAHFSSYNKGKAWIDWGVVRNELIDRVFVNGKEATIIEQNSLRIFYLVAQGNDTPNGSVYLYFDKYCQPVN